jgi:hypothetical protein
MRPDSPGITAWVKKVEPLPINLLINLNKSENHNSLELANFYAKNGIWYDALNILANLWVKSPDNLYAQEWGKFLSQDSVGLEDIATEPLLIQPSTLETE